MIRVENPADKSIGYCSVMGSVGEHYALGVYLDDERLYGFDLTTMDFKKFIRD